ncbi:HNH endonuclease [Mycobacterium sp. SMC-13]|uniref:HNH endonuclease n=1 Tax=Mycobacterium sp. SMC-13 TaxID=3381626 RepID=UPI0038770662
MNRPCLGCGRLIGTGSRCSRCTPQRAPRSTAHAGSDWRWRKLSAAQRKRVSYCELALPGCRRRAETADHIIPVSEAPELAHNELNIRSACRPCNAQRGDTCTDAERQKVRAAITARKQRWTNYMDATST